MGSTNTTPFTPNEIEQAIAQAMQCCQDWLPAIQATEKQIRNELDVSILIDRRWGELTPAYLDRQAEFKRQKDKRVEELIRRRTELRQFISGAARPLMGLAIRLNCSLQPQRLRTLTNSWSEDRHNQSPPAIVDEARGFLDDLILALEDHQIRRPEAADENNYCPAKECIEIPDFPTYKAVTAALDANEWIRRKRPLSKSGKEIRNRLTVHIGDWKKFLRERKALAPDPADLPCEVVDEMVREVEARKAEERRQKVDK